MKDDSPFSSYIGGYTFKKEETPKKDTPVSKEVQKVIECLAKVGGLSIKCDAHLTNLSDFMHTCANQKVLIHPSMVSRMWTELIGYRKFSYPFFSDPYVFNTTCSIGEAVGGEKMEKFFESFMTQQANEGADNVLIMTRDIFVAMFQTQNSERVREVPQHVTKQLLDFAVVLQQHIFFMQCLVRALDHKSGKYSDIHEKVTQSITKMMEAEEATA